MTQPNTNSPYRLLLVSTNIDSVIVQGDACLKCTERKLNAEILRDWPLNKEEFKHFKEFKTPAYRVKCICEELSKKGKEENILDQMVNASFTTPAS
jgi:hypothetical protein